MDIDQVNVCAVLHEQPHRLDLAIGRFGVRNGATHSGGPQDARCEDSKGLHRYEDIRPPRTDRAV